MKTAEASLLKLGVRTLAGVVTKYQCIGFCAALVLLPSCALLTPLPGPGSDAARSAGPRQTVQEQEHIEPSKQSPSLPEPRGAEEAIGRPVALPAGLGWHEIAETQLAPHCPAAPEIQGNTGCGSVILAWNGGVADLKRNRLIVWGGGHSDYYGNEVYAFDLTRSALERLTDPSPISNVLNCPEAYPDGRPSARHTYNGLVYVPEQDAMFSFGGSRSACGGMSDKIWKLDLGELVWTLMEPHRGDRFLNAPGIASDYDPNTRAVFFSDTASFFRYDPAANSMKKLADLHNVDDHLTGVIDPQKRVFLMAGYPGQFWAIDIGPHAKYSVRDWSKEFRGCEAILKVPDPGLAYDTVQGLIVAWAGGDSIYLIDTERKTCTEKSYPHGPGEAQRKGSFGRFRYFPEAGVFAIVNDWKSNVFVLRLTDPRDRVRGPLN